MIKVGRLTCSSAFRKDDGRLYTNTVCECGTEKVMRQDYINKGIKEGKELSCNCRQKEMVRQTGYANREFEYDRKKLSEARKNMIARCTDSLNHCYKYYGGKGVTVCQAWLDSLDAFVRDVGIPPSKKHQIDRIDTNGNYEPSNVRWVTRTENMRNRTNTTMVTLEGKTKPLIEWCEEFKMPYNLVRKRISQFKWDAKRALTEEFFVGKNQSYIA